MRSKTPQTVIDQSVYVTNFWAKPSTSVLSVRSAKYFQMAFDRDIAHEHDHTGDVQKFCDFVCQFKPPESPYAGLFSQPYRKDQCHPAQSQKLELKYRSKRL